MATPAAVLSILVKTQGAQAAAAQLGGIDKSGRAAAGGMGKAEAKAKSSSKALSSLGSAAKGAGVLLGAAGLAKGFQSAVSEFQESVKVGGQTTAVLKSTGGAANVTAKHIQNLAASISKKSGIDDETIQSSENMLLTFTKVRNETGKGNKIFDQATQVVTDMSAALGQSGKSSAIQLGKALNDPIKGITALRRAGVTFTEEQQNQIKTTAASGDRLGAQKLILRELKTEFAGSAAAQATAADKFKVALSNVAEAAGAVLVPVLDKVMGFLTRFFNQMVEGVGVGGALISKFREFGGALAPLGQSIAQIVAWLQKHEGVSKVLAVGIGVLTGAIIALNVAMSLNPFVAAGLAIAALVVGVVTAYREFATFRHIVDTVAGAVASTFPAISAGFQAVVGAVRAALPTIAAIARGAMAAFVAVFSAVWPVIKGYFTGGFIALKGIITGAAQVLSGAVTVIKGILHGDFREIWDGIKKIFTGGFTAVKGIISGAAHALGSAASAIGTAIKSAIEGPFNGVARSVAGFVNGIIDIINKIPGVNIGHVGVPQQNTQGNAAGGKGKFGPNFARGGAFAMTGGMVNNPMVMMGEEAPMYPEFVIPTNPAYRKRAQSLLVQAAGVVGDGLAKGGVLGAVRGAAKTVGGVVAGGAKALLGALPGTGSLPPWMKGMGSYLLDKAGNFIKDKVTDILPGGGGGGGGDTKGVASGLAPQVQRALEWARSHGWHGTVTSGRRSTAKQQYLWDNAAALGLVRGVSVAKPGTSMHERGLAVDVTDVPGFQRAMASAPANARLIWRGASDPVHFSTTGHKKGGIFGLKKGGAFGGNVRAVWQFLRGKGMSPAQAAGIIGVMQGESGQGLSTTATNQRSGAFGIAQWRGGRKSSLMSKRNPTSLQTQLQHLWSELQGPESAAFKRIKGAHSIDEAVNAWLFGFERPGPGEANLPGRTANARNVFNALRGVGGSAGKGAAGSTSTSGAASGAASATQKVSGFDMGLAQADLAIAQAQRGSIKAPGLSGRRISSSLQQIQALTSKRQLVGKRIRSIRKALKGHLSRGKRLALTQELTQRLGEHAQLGKDIADLRSGSAADTTGSVVGGDIGAVGGDIGDGTDPNQALIDAQNAAAEAAQRLADAMKEHQQAVDQLQAEIKQQNAIASSTLGIGLREAQRALADVISGQIGGYGGAASRALTAGAGTVVRY
jgi:tail lysozyme/D-alanyl-D-alanine carboxypeptidase-like protein